MCVCPCVSHILFVTQGTNNSDIKWGGTNIFHTQRGQTFIHTRGGTFSVVVGSGNGDVDGEKEEIVSEANILTSEVRKF